MLRTIPAAGHPISPSTILTGLLGRTGDADSALLSEFRHRTMTASGSAALALGLLALRELSDRNEVVIPAYTCPSVASAVLRAGLRPVLCDLREDTFRLDLDRSPPGAETLAVVVVHLFGIPDDVVAIRERASDSGAFVVEDATQCLESRPDGNGGPVPGSCGDLGVFSFGRGKPLSVLAGGAIVAGDARISAAVERVVARFPARSRLRFLGRYLTMLALYSAFFHPRLYWLPKSLPFLGLGETRFSPVIDMAPPDPLVIDMCRAAYRDFHQNCSDRVRLAGLYAEELADVPGCRLPGGDGARHPLLRYPVLLDAPARRDRVLEASDRLGLGATGMYPAPLYRLEGLDRHFAPDERFAVAESVSRRVLTLPLHRYVREQDARRLCEIVAGS